MSCGPLGSGVSSAHSISRMAAERFLQHAPGYGEDLEALDFDAFCEVARHVNHSSLGPDGVPYHAWLTGRGAPLRMLYAVPVALANGFTPLVHFNDALLVFIPKGGMMAGARPWLRSFAH